MLFLRPHPLGWRHYVSLSLSLSLSLIVSKAVITITTYSENNSWTSQYLSRSILKTKWSHGSLYESGSLRHFHKVITYRGRRGVSISWLLPNQANEVCLLTSRPHGHFRRCVPIHTADRRSLERHRRHIIILFRTRKAISHITVFTLKI